MYEACYRPVVPGTYLLNVTWGGRLVKGCPLTIATHDGGPNSAASKVTMNGSILYGTVSQIIENRFTMLNKRLWAKQSSLKA